MPIKMILEPRFSGEKHDEEGVVYRWQIFYKSEVETVHGAIPEECDNEYLDELVYKLVGWHAYDCGIGRAFGSNPNIRVSKKYIKVSQMCGYDI